MEGNSGPQNSEQSHFLLMVQDAVTSDYLRVCQKGRLPLVSGSDRGVLPRAHSPHPPTVSLLPLCGETLPIPGITIQPINGPRVFTKLRAALVGHLRTLPVRVQFYLDDILIQSGSEPQARRDLAITIQVLQDHRFSINMAKSHLVPTNRLLHLGAVINTVESKVYLSQERQSSLRELADHIKIFLSSHGHDSTAVV